MKVVLQRVSKASVSVDNKVVGKINNGLVCYVGFTINDNEEIIDKYINKIIKLRIFEDSNKKMNLSLLDLNYKILSISQFTLYADTTTGNRPSFINALNSVEASKLYDYFNAKLKDLNVLGGQGIFGADMHIEQYNEGPVTIIM